MKQKIALCAAMILAATMSLGATAAQAGAPIHRLMPVFSGLEGTVVTPDGEPAVGVTVTIWSHEPDSEPGAWNAYAEYVETTDSDGYFFAGTPTSPGPSGVFTVEYGGEGWSTVYAPGVDSPGDAEFYAFNGMGSFYVGEIVIDYAATLGQ
ncbi:MAG: hypothetical protein LBK59_03315 [Bifidobacteriaceae bacterium]|nr:hypothetical protein [Bifidobacteriaceae bacterium]